MNTAKIIRFLVLVCILSSFSLYFLPFVTNDNIFEEYKRYPQEKYSHLSWRKTILTYDKDKKISEIILGVEEIGTIYPSPLYFQIKEITKCGDVIFHTNAAEWEEDITEENCARLILSGAISTAAHKRFLGIPYVNTETGEGVQVELGLMKVDTGWQLKYVKDLSISGFLTHHKRLKMTISQ